MLLGGRARVFGEPGRFVARDASGLAVVYGSPDAAVIEAGLESAEEVVAPVETQLELPDWDRERAILYRLEGEPRAGSAAVRLVTREEIASFTLPEELREELQWVGAYCPVAACFAGPDPVSFSYAVEAERLFDMSIDTLADFRGRGYATVTAAWMIRFQRELGRAPVWGAVESNIASQRTAERLGFVPADEVMVYSRELD